MNDEEKNTFSVERSLKIADWHSEYLNAESETLYRSEDGEYFLVYEGGLFSSFHQLPECKSWYGGTFIRKIKIEDAIAWCEETGNYEGLERYLGSYRR